MDFPIDGNYGIEVAVDDRVTLRFIDRNGNETIIEKEGFTGPTERGERELEYPQSSRTSRQESIDS